MGVDLGVGLDVGAGRQLRPAKGIEGLLREDLARQLDARAELEAVLLGLQVVELDRRAPAADRRTVSVTEPRLVGRIGPTWAWKPWPGCGRAAVIARRDRQEVILQVGMLDAGMAADEAAGLEMVGGAETGAEERPLACRPGAGAAGSSARDRA